MQHDSEGTIIYTVRELPTDVQLYRDRLHQRALYTQKYSQRYERANKNAGLWLGMSLMLVMAYLGIQNIGLALGSGVAVLLSLNFSLARNKAAKRLEELRSIPVQEDVAP